MKKLILTCSALCLATLPAMGVLNAVSTNTVSPTLVVKLTVAKAVGLTLSTASHCTEPNHAEGDYNVSFGAADAISRSSATCSLKFFPLTSGTVAAVYYIDYTLMPVFSSQSPVANTLTAYVPTNFAKPALSLVQSNIIPAVDTDFVAVSKAIRAQTKIATNAVNGILLTRYLGVSVTPTSDDTTSDVDSAIITYTFTLQ